MNKLAEAYKKSRNININIQGGGATRGIRDVAAGTADLGGSCRFHLPDNELEKSIGYEPVAWDALAVIVNKNNPVNNISFPQIKSLYEGKINNWKQLGGLDAPVKLFVRKGKISGVGYTIRTLIFADKNKDFIASKVFKSSGPLEKGIESDPHAIAITGISSARLRDVKILSLNNIFPDYKTIKQGQYALYRPLFITFNPASPNIALIKDFIKFAHSNTGRSIMKTNGVVPYLEALRLVMKQVQQEQKAQNSSTENLTY
ncbi:MAG: substrate-binding domain-containing protein [Gammaproteobacteria bacterium]|nr:substrate-binding domain-containing protein [Gammaproteobacteria bacterium]